MPGQQDKKEPRRRCPSDYRPKKNQPSVLHPRVVYKEAGQHVFLYCVGDAVGSHYSEAAIAKLRRIAPKETEKPGGRIISDHPFPECHTGPPPRAFLRVPPDRAPRSLIGLPGPGKLQ